jgi:hypothetical protein
MLKTSRGSPVAGALFAALLLVGSAFAQVTGEPPSDAATPREAEEGERARLVEEARKAEERADRDALLRDVRQYQTIQRALGGPRR